ncbi:Wzz/FepE/Etk N-terminal domain-containing protein [Geodermatophilus sp. SYSU D00691]
MSTAISERSSQDASAVGLPGLRLLLRRSWWVALGLVVGLIGGFAAARALPPVYEATAILTVQSTGSGDPVSLSRAAQALARTATQPGVVGDPLRAAGQAEAAESPRDFVQVQAAPDAPIIRVTGTAEDPEDAREIADTVSETVAGVGPLPPFQATVAAEAPLPTSTTTPAWMVPVGGAAAGAALAVVLAATVPGRADGRRTRSSAA